MIKEALGIRGTAERIKKNKRAKRRDTEDAEKMAKPFEAQGKQSLAATRKRKRA